MSKPVIEVNHLSKVYNIGHEQKASAGTMTFRDALTGFTKKPLELITGHRMEKEKFSALNDINFTIEKGDVVGIIGRNGSGKSTLLKILSRIVEPTEGEIILRGKTGSLLEVGTGFHPELTGRENVYFNGAILGMSRKEIKAKFDDIVEFSGVEKFLDTPVKFYSSGMYVRLAFAVAAFLEPDILIVDEVLAVGDADFQKKSLGKMKSVTTDDKRTVLFVSHNMDSIAAICNKCIWMQAGKIIEMGDTNAIISKYSTASSVNKEKLADRSDRQGSGLVKCIDIQVKNSISEDRQIKFIMTLENKSKESFKDFKISTDLFDSTGNHLSNLFNYTIGQKIEVRPGINTIKLELKNINLVPGRYNLNTFIAKDQYNSEIFDWVEEAADFTIEPYDYYKVGNPPVVNGRFIYIDYAYEIAKNKE